MRSFLGTRGGGDDKKGKPSAAQMYKDQLAARKGDKAPPSKDEIYKKLIEDRMHKMMEDYLLGKKKNAVAIPGAKMDDKPKEVSKTTMTVIRMLAVRREQKERKMQKKKDVAFQRAKAAKIAEEKRQKMLAEQAEAAKLAALQAEMDSKNSGAASHFWGTDENKNSWW